MFRAGKTELTVCPSRMLEGAGWAFELVEWWLWSVTWDGGMPNGAPRWPYRGGLLQQPARVVQAAKILRTEWPSVRVTAEPKDELEQGH